MSILKKDEYDYMVSVIVPVYNVEEYLEECLESLVKQTMDKKQMEVLLIDDGSTDGSLRICKEYSELYEFFHVFSKENSGVSSTRNFGIRNARGKYIMYLDSDDTLGPETIKNVTSFFEKHYTEVDLVTYSEHTTINGVEQPLHFRYKYLVKSGIYDLRETPFAIQTRLGICVKNKLENNNLFDESIGYHEDQKYIAQIIEEKMKLGFCKEAVYFWKRNDSGIMGNNSNPIQVFEVATKLWENIFGKYDIVPEYFQAMFMHDINWKIRSNIFFPYHYNDEDFQRAINRIKELLKKVSVETIRNHPGIDRFHVYYYLRLKDVPLVGVVTKDICIYYQNQCIYKRKDIELIVNSIKIYEGKIKFDGFLKSPIFDFIEKPILRLALKKDNGTTEYIEMKLFDSAGGFYKSKTKTNLFWGFVYEVELPDKCEISFNVILDGLEFNVCYWFMERCNISEKMPELVTKRFCVTFNSGRFWVNKINKEQYEQKIGKFLEEVKEIEELPLDRLKYYFDKKVWLYYDCKGVEKDNGYYQFCNDINKRDGILRYYICANDLQRYEYLYRDFGDAVIKFGSKKHKLLYLAADKVITAYIEEKNMNPFEIEEYEKVKKFVNHQIVYLQHGILHAHLPWKYAPGRILADRIVVSSEFELDVFQNIHHFPNYMLIPSGMARFEKLDRNHVQKKKILFAPSWRNYLIGAENGNEWILTEEKFLLSNYYKKINAFLNDVSLEKVLEQYNMVLDFKIHPIFVPYLHLFDNQNGRVNFIIEDIIEEEYKLVITDFSSFIFNFVYLKRPIIYYVPDYLEFKAGLNQYWELELPFEKAFGKLVLEEEDLINEIRRICNNEFKIDNLYEERMKKFFLPIDHCCEKLYRSIMDSEKFEIR